MRQFNIAGENSRLALRFIAELQLFGVQGIGE